MQRLLSLFLVAYAALVVGCASAPYMPLADASSQRDASKPLFLMSVTVKNDYRQRWQPRILNVILEKDGGQAKPETLVFRLDDKGTVVADSGATTYLVRFSTDGAAHTVRGFNAMASAFPIHSFYFVPLHASVARSEGGVYYLGSVSAIIRERKDEEFSAGPVIPLLDQSIAGASTGTFDIEISDAFDAEMAMFRKVFSALQGVEIQRKVLSTWDRAKAQLYWEKN